MNQPFLKWAGGKRWLFGRQEFQIPVYSGRYIEPFLGGGAIFFAHKPECALLSDVNKNLIDTYIAIRDDWQTVANLLSVHQFYHCSKYYYYMRGQTLADRSARAAQFLYLNRACWNGLYRENLKGQFNVPLGTKSAIFDPDEDFPAISSALKGAEILASDFEPIIDTAKAGDLVFVDPPYTTAHNVNGFIKYNERIFSWSDQERLAISAYAASQRGANVIVTNADHYSIRELYSNFSASVVQINRNSVISGRTKGRGVTAELLIYLERTP